MHYLCGHLFWPPIIITGQKKETSNLNKARVSWKSIVWFPWELGAKALTACCYFPLTLLRDIFSKNLLHRRHDQMNSMPQLMVWVFLMQTIRTNLSKKIYWQYSRYLRVKGNVEQLGLRKERMEAALGIWVVSAENCHSPALHRSLSVSLDQERDWFAWLMPSGPLVLCVLIGQRGHQGGHLYFHALPRLCAGGRVVLKGNRGFLVQERRRLAV